MQTQATSSTGETKKPARVKSIDLNEQDALLRKVVRLMEAEQRQHQWSWSWLAGESELTASAYYAWRKGKTKGHFLRRINSVLKPLGFRLYVGRIK